jgi:hypothetical protein
LMLPTKLSFWWRPMFSLARYFQTRHKWQLHVSCAEQTISSSQWDAMRFEPLGSTSLRNSRYTLPD